MFRNGGVQFIGKSGNMLRIGVSRTIGRTFRKRKYKIVVGGANCFAEVYSLLKCLFTEKTNPE